MERLLLLDGNGLIYRGYFALIDQPLTTSKGELVTAVFGFTNIVLRAIADVQPQHIAVAFDLGKPTFRHERYAEYKGTRTRMPDDMREQIPKVRDVVAALAFPVYEREGFEADDVIATLTGQAEAAGLDVTILTGDLDMLQLVSERTRLMVSLRGGVSNTVSYDLARIQERWGLRPDQMLDYKALKGDPTDNIPGIPGVGEKTASKLIATWGSLDALYEHLDEVTPEKLRPLLAEHRETVLESRELMRLVRDVDVVLDADRGVVGEYDREAVVRIFREYEFRTLIDRLPPLTGERPEDAIAAMRDLRDAGFPAAQGRGPGAGQGPGGPGAARHGGGGGGGTRPHQDDGSLQLAMDFDMIGGRGGGGGDGGGAAGQAPQQHPIAVTSAAVEARAEALAAATGDLPGALAAAIVDPGRIELADEARVATLEPWLREQDAVGVAVVLDDPRPLAGTPLALAVAGADGRVVAAEGPAAAIALRHLLERIDARLVGHETKPLLTARFAEEPDAVPVPVAFDTQIAAYLVNAALRAQKIADVVAERLDLVLPPAAAALPPTAIAGLEALAALAVRPSLEQSLRDEGAERLFHEMELPLIPILARMEAAGIALDQDALSALEREFAIEIARLEAEIFAVVGHQFSIGSPKQLGELLFVELGLPKGRKTKTGYSTDATVLEELRDVHPVVGLVLDWRTYSKLRSTYVEALPNLIGPDGRLHTLFNQAVAATGRLSSSDPNLQNIPIRTPLGRRIRHAFVAGSPDTTLVAADYSQIELRILAHVSGDEHLRDAFAREADIHRETAARVLRKAPEDVTGDERSMAKMVNFGLAYGMSDFGLSSRAGISRGDAQEFITSYFAAYGGISRYMLHIRETAAERGHVATLLGRKRQIPELTSANRALRAAGERMAINMPIQGTAADIVKIAMIRMDKALRDGGFRARLLLSVHDELLLEAPRDEVDRLVPVLREAMENALPLSIPLTVEAKTGDSWEGMTPVSRRDAVLAEASEAPAGIEG
ncbi:MAG TPA: DNA polymerase I [Candidatus Limnocylindrales bacterium]|nr:DNA polymerase I [Candidatus Limnocylindrales bacterium]